MSLETVMRMEVMEGYGPESGGERFQEREASDSVHVARLLCPGVCGHALIVSG